MIEVDPQIIPQEGLGVINSSLKLEFSYETVACLFGACECCAAHIYNARKRRGTGAKHRRRQRRQNYCWQGSGAHEV
jgi:hypothetical protein